MILKKIFYAFVMTLVSLALQAQETRIVVFSENGEPFYLYMNNQLQNKLPQKQVSVDNLVLKDYQITIEFQDIYKPKVRKDLRVKTGREEVYVVYFENEKYTLDYYTKAKKGMYSKTYSPTFAQEIEMYQGKYGCAKPISDELFNNHKNKIEQQIFEEAKYQASLNLAQTSCISSSQLGKLALLIEFETERLELLKKAYSYVHDRSNLLNLSELFTFPESMNEFRKHITLHENK